MENRTLPYYRQPPSSRGRRYLLCLICAVLVIVGAWAAWSPVRRTINRYRESKAVHALYTKAQTHAEPPNAFIYSERSADFLPQDTPERGGATTYIYRGDQELRQEWLFDAQKRPFRGPNTRVLYRHKHASANGASGVVTVSFAGAQEDGLSLFASLTGETGGTLRSLYRGWNSVPLIAPHGTLRFYPGRPHATDPSRFSIRCEIAQTVWTIEGQLLDTPNRDWIQPPSRIALRLMHADSQDSQRQSFSPKSVVRALFQAMYDNDPAFSQTLCVTGADQMAVVQGMTTMFVAMRSTMDVAYVRYGEEFRRLAGGELDMAHIDPSNIDSGIESLIDDYATITLKPSTVMWLMRVNGTWKVDLVKSFAGPKAVIDPQMGKAMGRMFSATAAAADQTKRSIEAGAYPDARAAVGALQKNMKKAVLEQRDLMIHELRKDRRE